MTDFTQIESRMECDCDDEDTSHVSILDNLAKAGPVEIAIDTEYEGPDTLLIQAAMRIGDDLIVQLYRDPSIPEPPRSFRLGQFLTKKHREHYRRVKLRPIRQIHADLSPAAILLNLAGLSGLATSLRGQGQWIVRGGGGAFTEPVSAEWNERRGVWKIPEITVSFIGHFLAADLGRIFGARFYKSLFCHDDYDSRLLRLGGKKLLRIIHPDLPFVLPDIEYIHSLHGDLYRLRMTTRDLMLPFGPASLDRHCQTFLGVGKSDALTTAEKEQMGKTFCKKTSKAYGYAGTDVINTLLVHERMQEEHERVYHSFGFQDGIPPFRPTMGRRVSDFIVEMFCDRVQQESVELGTRRAIRNLMRRGSVHHFIEQPRTSRFGTQTGGTHGGLIITRSPTRFWHDADGQLRDADMAGCYNRIIANMNVYYGRPIVLEPGDRNLTLAETVKWLTQHTPNDGWMIRVTGDLPADSNTLIPSTLDARTMANVRHQGPLMDAEKRQGAKLFTARIESGIVTHATWCVINALPEPLRSQYRNLTTETILAYPHKFITRTGEQYDHLVSSLKSEGTGWQSNLDLDKLIQTDVERLDDSYVSVQFPICEYAQRFRAERQQAQIKYGKGSGADVSWKLLSNAMYGVLTSSHLPTQNIIAANVVTATARAHCWLMLMTLNAIQAITDGVTYRRDQIPACTFAECLKRQPDYTLRRAEDDGAIPFLAPDEVPEDDAEFTEWLRHRFAWFFETESSEFLDFIALPEVEHKRATDTRKAAFDALACDGSGNYLKCRRTPTGELEAYDAAMRGYSHDSKKTVIPWILETYSTSYPTTLCPLATDTILLKLEPAKQAARRALENGERQVVLPLGFHHQKILAYKAVKASAFVFRTPHQFKTLKRQIERFQQRTACGLELLCFRRPYAGQEPLSLPQIAENLFAYIREGGHDLTKKFNLNRLSKIQERMVQMRIRERDQRRHDAQQDLIQRCRPKQTESGIIVRRGSILLRQQ